MSFNFSPKIVTDSLILYLDTANSKSYLSGSTIWNDLSRIGNNGTLENGPTYNPNNGGSIVFDGTDDRVQIPYPDTDWSTTPWTIDFWMKIDTLGNRGVVCLNSSDGSQYVVNNVFFTDNKSYWYFIKNSTGTRTSFTQLTGIYNTNEIFNFTMTYNGLGLSTPNVSFYKNGVQLTTIIGGNAGVSNLNGIQIGGTNYPFDGNIYSFKLYNKSLSSSEVVQNFNTTKSRFGL